MRGKAKANEGKRSRAVARKTRRSAAKARVPAPQVMVTFRHVEPTEAIRAYAVRKLSHVAKFLKRSCEVHLILSVDKYRHCGEVVLKSANLDVAAQEQTKDLYSVIDLLTDKLGRQIKSHLGKTKTKKVRAPSAGEILSEEEAISDAGSNPPPNHED
jgi:putative sigma-54 modulation protein